MDLGKPKNAILAQTVWRMRGAHSNDVITGPTQGIDVSVLKLGHGRVMLANSDPISLLPAIGPAESARMSVYEVASDVATTGHSPTFAMFDLNMPPELSDSDLRKYWRSIHYTCKKLGVSILGGHTGRFEGCDYSILGSATMWTTCLERDYLTTNMAEDGDDLILTRTAAYGATAVLSKTFPRTVRKQIGHALFEEATSYFPKMNTVSDSLAAVESGIHENGVTAIHNVSEGGVSAAVSEVSSATSLGAVIDIESVPISRATSEVSKLFHIDPLVSLGEGSLLITANAHNSDRVIRAVNSHGTRATIIGRITSKVTGVRGTIEGRTRRLRAPVKDPYWTAYWRAVKKRWS